jgi:hypothetical protein
MCRSHGRKPGVRRFCAFRAKLAGLEQLKPPCRRERYSLLQADMVVLGAQMASLSLRRDRHGLTFVLEIERIVPDDPPERARAYSNCGAGVLLLCAKRRIHGSTVGSFGWRCSQRNQTRDGLEIA